MTDLRKAAEMALEAMEFNDPLIEDYGSKEQLNSHKEAIVVLYKALAQPEQGCAECGKKASEGYALYCVKCTESFKPDWDMIEPYHERIKELEIALAQPEQEPINKMPTKIFGPSLEQILNAAGFYKREWVGLTDEEIIDGYCKQADGSEWAIDGLKDAIPFARIIEAALRSKNHD